MARCSGSMFPTTRIRPFKGKSGSKHTPPPKRSLIRLLLRRELGEDNWQRTPSRNDFQTNIPNNWQVSYVDVGSRHTTRSGGPGPKLRSTWRVVHPPLDGAGWWMRASRVWICSVGHRKEELEADRQTSQSPEQQVELTVKTRCVGVSALFIGARPLKVRVIEEMECKFIMYRISQLFTLQ